MGRFKLKMAWSILYLLVGLLLMAVGVGPIIYIYFVHDAPTGPSEPVTTAASLMYACILMALVFTTLEGIASTAKAIHQLITVITGEKKGVGIDNEDCTSR